MKRFLAATSVSVAIFCLSLSQVACAEDIKIAVASNFADPMKKIVAQFEAETNHHVIISYGASGKFYAQIKNGAPFEIFFSADQDKPITLEQENLIVAGSRFTYAIGRLALWSSKPNIVDDKENILKTDNFRKLAIANPKVAPYGKAAIEVLQALKVHDAVQHKLVMGENIAQTYQFVSTANAELGFVALSQIVTDGKIQQGSAWVVPTSLHSPIRQDAVLLIPGQKNKAAQELLKFMQTDKAKSIIKSYGYNIE